MRCRNLFILCSRKKSGPTKAERGGTRSNWCQNADNACGGFRFALIAPSMWPNGPKRTIRPDRFKHLILLSNTGDRSPEFAEDESGRADLEIGGGEKGMGSLAERLGHAVAMAASTSSSAIVCERLRAGAEGRSGGGVGWRAGRVVTVAIKDPAAQDRLKRAVAKKAVELVKSGMVVGLGTGSTSQFFIEELGILLAQHKLKDVECVATSYQSRVLSRQFGVETVDLNDVNRIDIAFDGADEVDSAMHLIKGGGAAHTMEKVVDSIAKRCVILVDETKVVKTLGLTFPVPVEVLPFALAPVLRALAALGGHPEIRTALRKDGPVISDLGNMVVDVRFPEGVQNPAELERQINRIPGVVENGLFVNIADSVLVGTTDDGHETSVVEFADFVQSLRSSEEVSA